MRKSKVRKGDVSTSKSLSNYRRRVEELDRRYSKLSDQAKSQKWERYRDQFLRILIQLSLNEDVRDFVEDEFEDLMIYVSKFLEYFNFRD